MLRIKTKKIHNTALLFIIIAPITILYYASYIFDPSHMGNPYLYILQLIADLIAITIVATLWLTILLDMIQPEYHKREFKYSKKWLSSTKPIVDILIPIANEPIEIVEETIRRAQAIEYPHTTYILDDGDSDEVRQLAHELNLTYIARPLHEKKYAKSGNLNYGLQQCKGDFFAVFDADHAPTKEFLTELLPFFENEKVALIQTPQHYTNTDQFIAAGTAQAQEIFYKYVQPAKNSYNAAFCVGTNMVYRRSAIDEIGGIALRDHSEDIWTTILIHEKGHESVFYNKVLAYGRAPETIPAFFRQQNRWARGGFTLFFSHNPLFIDALSIDQRLQYFFSNIHYFSSVAILIYLLLPLLYLLFGWHPMDVKHNDGWLTHYIPYFITVYFLPWFLLGSLKLATVSTSIASFAPYLQALLSVFLKNKYTWVATESRRQHLQIMMLQIWPHIFFITLSFLAVAVGWYNPDDGVTTIVTSFWVMVNAYFLFAFVKNGITQSVI